MKKILLIALIAAFAMVSCDDESSRGVSYVTTYVTFTMNDAEYLFWQLNTPFVDPGCTGAEGETNVTDQIDVSSDVDATSYGAYSVDYKAKNSDGFWSGVTRNVYVCEKNTPLTGVYTSKIVLNSSGKITKLGPFNVVLYGIGDGKYAITDLLGGWYEYGSSYGPDYAGSATLQLNVDNTFSVVSANPMGWGYPCELTAGTSSTFDPETETLVLKTNMEDEPDMKFVVTLTKN